LWLQIQLFIARVYENREKRRTWQYPLKYFFHINPVL
jgi:hypothetical protein